MQIRVRVFGDLVSIIGRNPTVDLEEGETVGALAREIAKKAVLTRTGHLGRYKVGGADMAILVNGKNIALLDGVGTVLKPGDDVVFLIPNMGG